jgi:hypothetical protein
MNGSVLAGILFGAANLWLLFRIIRIMISGAAGEKVSKSKTLLLIAGKLLLLFLTIGLLLVKRYVTPLPFLGGFTISLIAGIAVILWKGKGLQDV